MEAEKGHGVIKGYYQKQAAQIQKRVTRSSRKYCLAFRRSESHLDTDDYGIMAKLLNIYEPQSSCLYHRGEKVSLQGG